LQRSKSVETHRFNNNKKQFCTIKLVVDISGRDDSNKWLVGLLEGNRLSNLLDKKSSLTKNVDLILKVWQTVWGIIAVRIVGAENDRGVVKIVRATTVDGCLRSSADKRNEDQGEKETQSVHLGCYLVAEMNSKSCSLISDTNDWIGFI